MNSTGRRIGCILNFIACNKGWGTANSSDRKVTVYDIAQKLSLSASTVSRVLNNSSLVGDETRERIIRAAEELGYHKRRIRRHGRRAILNVALFLPFGGNNYLHLFYDAAELIHAIALGFGDVRANIITVVNNENVHLFDHKKTGDIDACVFGFTSPRADLLEVIDAREIPAILINRIDPHHNYVVSDHAAGMRCLLQELVTADPAVRPCYLGFPVIEQVSTLRRDGLLRAAAMRGLNLSLRDCYDVSAIDEITPELIETLLDAGYNAVMCFNDVFAAYTYQCALQMGLRIPEDFSLTGFDNSPVRRLVSRPIVSIDLAVSELGFQAGKWLRDAIIEKREAPLQLHIPGALVEGSTIRSRQS